MTNKISSLKSIDFIFGILDLYQIENDYLRKVTFDDILVKLIKGEQEEAVTVTIPEGYTVQQLAKLLEEKGWLAENALIYVEQAKQQAGLVHLPANWILQKDKQVGDVHFSLYTR